MYRFIETIKIEEGRIINPELHNYRLNSTRKKFFDSGTAIDIKDHIKHHEAENPIIRCTIIYDQEIRDIRYLPYVKRTIKTLGLVYDDEIEYSYKYENRDRLNKLKESRQDCDEIMIVKNGCITDTSFSNLVFFDGKKFLTPTLPLLNGTKRMFLLQQGRISEATIKPEDLNKFHHCGLINAMLDEDDYRININMIKI